jgi:hypothetical protein
MKMAARLGTAIAAARPVAEAMGAAQRLAPFHTPGVRAVSGGALGYVSTADQFSKVPLRLVSRTGNVLLASGVPISLGRPVGDVLVEVVEGDSGLAEGG